MISDFSQVFLSRLVVLNHLLLKLQLVQVFSPLVFSIFLTQLLIMLHGVFFQFCLQGLFHHLFDHFDPAFSFCLLFLVHGVVGLSLSVEFLLFLADVGFEFGHDLAQLLVVFVFDHLALVF